MDDDHIEEQIKKNDEVNQLAEEEDVIEEEEKDVIMQPSRKEMKLANQEAKAKKKKVLDIFSMDRNRAQKVIAKQAKKTSGDGKSYNLRCPIICVLGHVDTGKTLLLDKIRSTNVQAGEAGGITQQIGATYFPYEALSSNIKRLGTDDMGIGNIQIPGLLVIDTPGHESFTNLRSRGSSLCDLAVLVVDIMHGLEKQTLESIELLRQKGTPFIVALNKIDRCHDWKSEEYSAFKKCLIRQDKAVLRELNDRRDKSFLAFAEHGMNVALYYENPNEEEYTSVCPTSAMTGEGIPDLIGMLVKTCQTTLKENLIEQDDFECTVLEVKMIEGHGTTIDVVLLSGKIHVGDIIVVAGLNGPIVTKIRALLTPQPMKEMRIKTEYMHHETLTGAMGIKISAPDLEEALAGGELLRSECEDDVEDLKDQIMDNFAEFLDGFIDKNKEGVCVQASTLGSLEALL